MQCPRLLQEAGPTICHEQLWVCGGDVVNLQGFDAHLQYVMYVFVDIMKVGISIVTWLQWGMIAFPSCVVQPSVKDSSVRVCM